MNHKLADNSFELSLQRLADGELDAAQTRDFVVATDADANAQPTSLPWRRVALTLIENQMWQAAFRQADVNAEPNARLISEANERLSSPEIDRQVTAARTGFSSWPALAAGLLVAATLGYVAGSVPGTSGTRESSATQLAGNVDSTEDNASGTPQEHRPQYHLRLPDVGNDALSDSSIPLYEPAAFKAMQDQQPIEFYGNGMSNADLQRLYRNGYQVQQNVNFMSGKLDDGRSFVVPVRTINLSTGQ